ncbi:neurexin-1-like isoform X3 [Mercenaria mercenaria]|uniref:neurexin-1-like isoform X3 n=1 Tax=Mercenaria mercenaria TaxID=6596 RepID=UPI00234EAD80|nr:neurexin-1-like isoform X3 [Mercenaria mercenaria]
MAVEIVMKVLQWFIILSMNVITFSYSFDMGGASHSFSKFESWVPCHNGTITFEFQTHSGSGMLMYIDGGRKSNDYFELKLINGVLHLTFKLNNERNMLSAGQNLNNNEWHSVDLIRDGRLTTLKVDEFSYTRENQNYDPTYITFENSNNNYVFIGGLPSEYSHKLSELAHPQIMFEPRLQGSVRNLFYSNCGKAMTSPQMLESEGLVMEGDKCMKSNPCKNDGICVMQDHGVQCDCSWTNFVGEYCEIERQPIEAMFQGAQYLTYDLTRRGDSFFSSNDELRMHFKTTQMSGLLFYTGEDNDYMTVSLKNGAIHVDINLGSGPFNKRVDMGGYKLDDGQWHEIVITRNSRQLTYGRTFCDIDIKVDGTSRAKGSTMGEFTKLSSNILYVGGSSHPRELLGSPVRTNFRGCMKKVEYKADSINLELIEMANRDDNLITVMGDVVFGKCEEVIDSQPVTYTTPDSFVALPRWDVKKNSGTISFQFQTTEPDGLVMYNSGTYGSSNFDFFAMEIIDSYFYLIMDLGTGAIKEKVSRTEVDDGVPHIVHFQYSGRTGFIRVDAHETEYVTPGMGMQLDLEDMLFIGGLNFQRYNSYRLPKELWSGILKHGFVGCIQDMMINDEKVDLMTVARKQLQRDIKSECQKMDAQCLSQPCLHGGTCSEGWNRYACDCTNTSYKGKNCENAVATVSFSEAQYVLVTLPQESYTEAEDISLRFRTVRSSGLLLVTSSAISEDAIELYLERGACKLTITLGTTGSKTLSVGHALNDDQWHTVYVKRRGQKLELRIDNSRPVEDVIPHIAPTVRVKQMVLGSMGPLLSDFTVSSRSSQKSNSMSGGMQNDAPIRQHPWFVGAMQQFVYNGNHFFDMARETDGEYIENIDVTARFDDGNLQVHNAITFESQEAYVTLPHQLLKSNSLHFSFNFKFKTQQRDGLILFSGLGPDFLAIELYQGFLNYIYDMGGGTKRILVNTPEALNDNKWHDVSLFRPQMDQQQIRVDDNPATVEDMKGYSARHFDLKGPLYIGGLVKSRFFSLSVKIMSRNGFLGCIASFDINGENINILEAATYVEQTSAHSVTSGCSGSELTCLATSCYNGGRCEQQWNSFKCNCDMTSFTGSHCADESVTYQFGLGKGLVVFEYPEDARPSTKTDYLALGITTIQTSQAKILRVDSADTDDYIEVELVNGNIFMVYNMGQENIPVVTLQQKVNDGKYHVIRFHRSGTDAVLEVDWERQDKNPVGQKMSVFNSQARIMIGGRKISQGDITHAFQGTVSGVVFNGMRILDLLKEGDPRVSAEGNVSLVNPSISIPPPVPVKTPSATDKGVQSTQGFKNEIFKRSIVKENSARRRQKTSNKRSSRYYLRRKNMIDQQHEFDEQLTSQENMIIKEKQTQLSRNHQNVAKNHARKSHHKTKNVNNGPSGPSYVTKNLIGASKKDHVIGGNIHSAKKVGSVENDDTDVEYSGYSMIDTETFPTDDDSLKRRTKGDYWKESAINKFITMTLFLPADHRVSGKETQHDLKVHVGQSRTEPFARDSRHTFYPKDRGKPGKAYWRKGRPGFTQHSNKKHSKSTTPKQGSDEIITSSGEGPDCYSDDEDECIQTTSGSDDDIIKPSIVITRLSTPKPEPEDQGNYTCKDKDCKPQGTELAPPSGKNITVYDPQTTNPNGKTTDLSEPRTRKSSSDSGHLNIFLIVGIACGVLVALMILLVALYKFRSRDEGSYRVDESQNFAYLEAKKQQANGAAATNIGNGKAGGKKKDVKEWYV